MPALWAAGFTVLRSLRDSLSAFVWHFITPLDCRIKHPAKGIPTLAAPRRPSIVAFRPRATLARACNLSSAFPRVFAWLAKFLARSCDRFVRVSRFPAAGIKTRYPETSASRCCSPSAFSLCVLPFLAPPPPVSPHGRLCRSMTRLVIQEGKREKGPSGRTLWNYGRWKTGPTSLSGAAAIAVSNLPADIRCRVTRVANAIDQDEPVARTCPLSRCGTERNGTAGLHLVLGDIGLRDGYIVRDCTSRFYCKGSVR